MLDVEHTVVFLHNAAHRAQAYSASRMLCGEIKSVWRLFGCSRKGVYHLAKEHASLHLAAHGHARLSFVYARLGSVFKQVAQSHRKHVVGYLDVRGELYVSGKRNSVLPRHTRKKSSRALTP